MAVASLIISIAGFILSFIFGFPVSYFLGPPIGAVFGIISVIFGAIAFKGAKTNLTKTALVISIILLVVSVIRIFSLLTCVGRVASCIGCIAAGL